MVTFFKMEVSITYGCEELPGSPIGAMSDEFSAPGEVYKLIRFPVGSRMWL